MQRPHIAAMQARMQKALKDARTFQQVLSDFCATLEALGLHPGLASNIAHMVLEKIVETNDIEDSGRYVLRFLKSLRVNGKSVVEVLHEKLAGRADLIYSQVSPFLKDARGKLVDWGCGDGQVSQRVRDRLGLDVIGFDVRDYRADGVTIPINMFDGEHTHQPDTSFDAGLMTNVLHHEADNERILRELQRVLKPGARLVVIETVPEDDTTFAFDVNLFNDWLYNCGFHDADVPVPGTYETKENWPIRFSNAGFDVAEVIDLGFDQETIKDRHVIYVTYKR